MSPRRPLRRPVDEEPPPFRCSWRQLYLLVVANLGVCIVLFYLFMRAFS